MIEVAPGMQLEVDRGPDWLFVRMCCDGVPLAENAPLAQSLWELLEQHFTHRLVLELDQLPSLGSSLVGQLVLLHKRIHLHDGVMRLCGLSDANQQVLRICRLEDRFPQFENREQAVQGHRPKHPR